MVDESVAAGASAGSDGAGVGTDDGGGVDVEGVQVIPHVVPPRAPTNVWLRLPPRTGSVRDAVQRRPGFKAVFAGVLLDWSHLASQTDAALLAESQWMHTQRLSAGVDLSSAINLFPGFRLGNFSSCPPTNAVQMAVCDDGAFYNQSMVAITDVLRKAALIGSTRVLLVLHEMPELGPDSPTTIAMVTSTLHTLMRFAAQLDPPVTLHLRGSVCNTEIAGASAAAQNSWVHALNARAGVGAESARSRAAVGADAGADAWGGAGTMRFAPNTGVAAVGGMAASAFSGLLSNRSIVLAAGATQLYISKRRGSEAASVSRSSTEMQALVVQYVGAARAANATIVLDGTFLDDDAEAHDVLWLEDVLASSTPHPAPPSPPPSPTPPTPPDPPPGPRSCYKQGTPIKGYCTTIHGAGASSNQQIVFGCGAGVLKDECYADYMLPSGSYARAYGNATSPPLAANANASTTTLSADSTGKWTLAVTLAGAKGAAGRWVWAADPTGYLPSAEVARIECSFGVAFTCVE
jgi:hypothetical protein